MNILFITSNRLGDAVLSTGLLNHIVHKWPDAKITVACGPIPAPLFDGLPGKKRVISLRKKKYHGHWLALWARTVLTRWDVVVDLRDSAVSRLIWADVRYIYGRRVDRRQHKVEQCAAVMSLGVRRRTPPAPCIWPSPAQMNRAQQLVPSGGPVIGIGPAANWIGKTWPVERFISLTKSLTAEEGVLPGARIAVFAAPGEEEIARQLLKSVPQERQIDVIAKADAGTVAAALARCDLYVGNDSGLMHCAAAAGVPTFGLFGPSYPALYRPWGAHTAYAATPETFDQLTAFPGYNPKTLDHNLMETLSTETVLAEINRFWAGIQSAADGHDDQKDQAQNA